MNKYAYLMASLLMLVINAMGGAQETSATVPDIPVKGYRLIWSDEFNGTALDMTKWDYRSLGPRRDAINVKETVSLDGVGHLVLTTKRDGNEVHTAMIGTESTFQATFGYYECRAKLQDQIGHWSAFWLQTPGMGKEIGNPETSGTEIDIFEYLSRFGDGVVHNLHWDGYQEHHKSDGGRASIPGLSQGWHTFGLLWTDTEYVFYVDGQETWRTSKAVSKRSEYIILSLEVGKWAGDIAEAELPDSFYVDYVRVYQRDTAEPSSTESWPGWRGPRGDGTSLDKNVPTKWSGSENVVWKVPIPGSGHASPIIWDDRIFIVTSLPEKNQRCLICLERKTGQTLWTKTVLTSPLERKHNLNSFASSTPVTDGKLIYVSFLDEKDMFIAAYDFQGNQEWAVRPGPFSSVHGYCASPILYKNTVIINGDHDGDAYIVALNKDTGTIRWKTVRENRTRSYCTPIIRDIDGRTQMILSGSLCVASYDPNDGSRYWIIDGPTEQYVASLVYDGELIYLTCGFPQEHLMGIRPTGVGNVTDTHVVWHHRTKDAAYVPSPIVVNGYYIVADDFGTVTCHKARSGELQWRERLARHYSASILEANGQIYLVADQGIDRNEQGVTTIIRPGPKLDIVTKNILGEPVYASPAVSNGQLFLRGEKHLYCIGVQ